jgi:hypothetical protein
VEVLAFFFFVVAAICGIVALANDAAARILRRQVAQLQAQIAAMGQQLLQAQYAARMEAGGRHAANQAAQQTAQQVKAAQREIAELARSSERSGKIAAKELERSAKDAADAQRRGQQVVDRYVTDTVKRAEGDMNSSNFETLRTRVDKVTSFCAAKGFPIPPERSREIAAALRTAFEESLRREAAREEQRRVKEQIREEARAERERQQELARLEADEKRLEKALAEALTKAKGEHDAEVERLKQMLAEAESKAQRAKSQAQITRAGFVYVISNIGSFGDGVFKVGMTRRLEPMDRVIELGDASVPFAFDVHMMIGCSDAPSLETALHRELNHYRVNKVNLRKEFFRVALDKVVEVVKKHHGTVEYRAEPEALEYRETLLMEQRGQDPAYDPRQDEENEDPAIERVETVAG